MKKLRLYLPMVILLGSCIQSEPLNTEADITGCKILNAQGISDPNIKGNIIIENTRVRAQANPKIDLTNLALKLELTEGATISPDPAKLLDYSSPRTFTVTSQDGNWHKEYSVTIDTFDMPVRYGFEHYELDATGRYQVFYEEIKGHDAVFKQYIWASGNSGYAIVNIGKIPQDYPTVSIDGGVAGKGIRLQTKSTGGFGETVKMPIAAGNLFLGSFDVNSAVAKPLQATKFGLPFGKKPLRFKGSYNYKPGTEPFKAKDLKGNAIIIPGQEDSGDIYAVLYEAEGLEGNALDGNNVLTSRNIVAMARVDVINTDGFVTFDEEFLYREKTPAMIQWPPFILNRDASDDRDGVFRAFDPQKLKNYEYNLAVVFTSSKYGAYFAGSVGSTLCVDEVEVICE